jgi:UDP-glucose 4-epimerase
VTDFAPEQIRLLTHGRVVDTTQMRDTLGFEPTYTTAETFHDFARSHGPGLLPPARLAAAVDRLAAAVPPAHGKEQGPWPTPR